MIRPQLILDVNNEIIVDNFAGGGGASHGIEQALGRHVDVAVNHDPLAIALHSANHPQTKHLCEDVFKVDPLVATSRRPVGLAWFSPDCKHFSKAKGGKPRSKKIRGLAWVVIKWVARFHDAKLPLPRVIVLENVEEFQDWGPLLPNGEPCPKRKGATFKSWIKRLQSYGYEVQWREMRACDYGAPTIRKRLYLIARCDGKPIVWPTPTHANPESPGFKAGKLKPWRTAAECIDWSIPCHSIFLTKKEGRAVGVKRPLAEATMRRLARGTFKFVLNAKEPFIVPLTHQGSDRVESCTEPFRTITGAHRGEKAVAVPYVTEHANASNQRTFDIDEPLRTQCAEVKGGHFALVNAFLAKHYTGVTGSEPKEPIGTITSVDHHSLVTGTLIQTGYGERKGQKPRVPHLKKPLGTIVGTGKHAVVAANLMKFRGDSPGADMQMPLPTITAGSYVKRPAGAGHALGLEVSHLSKFYGTNIGQSPTEPMHSITAQGNHIAHVMAFLLKYYSEGGQDQDLREPMHTVVTKDRLGLVTIQQELYRLIDICMRMLVPRELYRGQGFPESYIVEIEITAIRNGKPKRVKLSQEAQVRMCGNSVCPPVAAAIVAANVPEMAAWHKSERRPARRKQLCSAVLNS